MEHFIIAATMVAWALIGIAGHIAGKADLAEVQKDLVTARELSLNRSCLVNDLWFDIRAGNKAIAELVEANKALRADALAYNQSKGLWCTDQPDLIKHHAKKERFFRLGYPEHKL